MGQLGYLIEGLFEIVGNFSNVIVEVLTHVVKIPGFPDMTILELLSGTLLGTLIIFFIIKAIIS